MISMADYIDKNILCQAYVHIDLPEGITPEELDAIKNQLREFTEQRAKFFVYPDVEIEIEFREGSLKSYISIAGAIYLAIAQYGSFRGGVDYLHTDIKRLADSIVSETLFMTRARHDHIRRTEARVGIVGSLKSLTDDMNMFSAILGGIAVDEAAVRLNSLKEDSDRLLENVRDPRDQQEIEDAICDFTDTLPTRCPYPKDKSPDAAAVALWVDSLNEMKKRYGRKKPSPPTAP
jgi:hypothetical protein